MIGAVPAKAGDTSRLKIGIGITVRAPKQATVISADILTLHAPAFRPGGLYRHLLLHFGIKLLDNLKIDTSRLLNAGQSQQMIFAASV